LMILPVANLSAADSVTIDLSQEKVGAEPSTFAAPVGKWPIGAAENNKKVLVVDGKIGVWSKADSVVYFDDYRVVKNAP